MVTATHTWADGSSVDVIIDDSIDTEYHPIRTGELTGLARDLLRNVIADREHSQAEHDKADG